MSRWQFWNIEGFAILLLMVTLAWTIYHGILRTDDETQVTPYRRRVLTLVLAIVLFVVVSWLVSFWL